MQLVIFIFLTARVLAQARGNGTSSSNGDTQCPVDNIPGFFSQGDCSLLCRPSTWTDVIVFYLGNYIAHAATIISRPGQSTLSSVLSIGIALIFPGGGVRVGVQALCSLANFAPSDLQIAARAGALCAVVRVPKEALEGASVEAGEKSEGPVQEGLSVEDGSTAGHLPAMPDDRGGDVEMRQSHNIPGVAGGAAIEKRGDGESSGPLVQEVIELEPLIPKEGPIALMATKIHGFCQLPEGYELMVVPTNSTFEEKIAGSSHRPPWHRRLWNNMTTIFKPKARQNTAICCSYNPIKIFISLIQLLFAISTLYRARGDQIERYGYAAFGLTVAPYAWMSFVNLLGNMMCPQYETMFVVESSGLRELQDRLNRGTAEERERFGVEGTVGRLSESANEALPKRYEVLKRFGAARFAPVTPFLNVEGDDHSLGVYLLAFYIAAVPIAIIGGLSGFHRGQSTLPQRVWTMMWTCLGFSVGAVIGPMVDRFEGRPILWNTTIDHRSSGIWFGTLTYLIFYGAAPIGGYVVVAQMLSDFGTCIKIPQS